MKQLLCALAFAGCLILATGCPSADPTAEELGIAGAEVQNANSVRQDLGSIMETVNTDGAAAAAESAQYVEENMAALVEDPASADHAETYQKIASGIAEIKGMSSAGDIKAKLEELQALAEELPKEE